MFCRYNVIGSDSSDDDSGAENTSASYVPAPPLPSQHTTLFTPPPFRPNNSRPQPQPWEPLTSNRDNDEYPALRPSLPLALQTPTNFKKERDALARKLLREYNARVFGGQLPDDLEIKWNARLATTAGITHYKRTWAPGTNLPLYTAHIELSSKVIDTESKLQRTLCHEMCHVAAWLIDHVAKPPHGPVFKKWAAAGMAAYPHLDITTCHAYEIFYAFRWQCGGCSQVYGRHSNSIDVGKKVCGQCRGMLQFMVRATLGCVTVLRKVLWLDNANRSRYGRCRASSSRTGLW
jgi:predicted SprT family Zn-dependent metalloprotease